MIIRILKEVNFAKILKDLPCWKLNEFSTYGSKVSGVDSVKFSEGGFSIEISKEGFMTHKIEVRNKGNNYMEITYEYDPLFNYRYNRIVRYLSKCYFENEVEKYMKTVPLSMKRVGTIDKLLEV